VQLVEEQEPQTVEQLRRSPNAAAWRTSDEKELDSHHTIGTFDFVERPEGVRVHKSSMIRRLKRDSQGLPFQAKSRLVAKGYSQLRGVDFDDISAPTPTAATIRILFALAAELDLQLYHIDFATAFINATVKEDIYLSLPPGFEVTNAAGKDMVLKLKRSIYGLRQSSHNWNETLHKVLIGYGMQRSKVDPCLYYKALANDDMIMLAVHVDDLLGAAASSEALIDDLHHYLNSKFKCKVVGAVEHFLGVRVTRDRANRTIHLDQQAYLERMLERYGMADCSPAPTPAAEHVLEPAEPGSAPDVPYQEVVGSLLWAALNTRLDIGNAVRALAKHMHCYGDEHWRAAKRTMRYIKGTLHYKLRIGPGTPLGTDAGVGLVLTGHSDADYAGDQSNSRSISGCVVMLGASPVSWFSRQQDVVAKSSMESEYYAVDEVIMSCSSSPTCLRRWASWWSIP
jgi:hypothetical protein